MTTLVATPVSLRRTLLAQIARLEADLPAGPGRATATRPRLQTVAELERIRDDLYDRIRERRFTQGEEQERARRLREEMLLHPERHRGAVVRNEEMGEPGCTRWICLGKWFRIKISSGCP